MRCNNTDIYITRGDTGIFNIEIDLDKLFNITEVKFTVKRSAPSQATISKINATGIATTGDLKYISKTESTEDTSKFTWIYSIEITPNDTNALGWIPYRYDVQIKYEDVDLKEYVLTIIKPSLFNIEEDITGV